MKMENKEGTQLTHKNDNIYMNNRKRKHQNKNQNQ